MNDVINKLSTVVLVLKAKPSKPWRSNRHD